MNIRHTIFNFDKLRIPFFLAITFLVASCTNPFAPAVSKEENAFKLGDQTTIEGVFKNFSYAYKFKDTLLYGKLLHPDFTFIYRNYDKNIDPSWTREEDMIATARMFNSTQELNLIWNDIVSQNGDSLNIEVTRSFSLSINFSSTDIVNVYGKAIIQLTRLEPVEEWKIIQWRDESNF